MTGKHPVWPRYLRPRWILLYWSIAVLWFAIYEIGGGIVIGSIVAFGLWAVAVAVEGLHQYPSQPEDRDP